MKKISSIVFKFTLATSLLKLLFGKKKIVVETRSTV
jgi:hypothetical protein